MAATITPEHPGAPDATDLIAELDAHLEPLYPSKSRHGFSVDKLIAESVAFFLVRDGLYERAGFQRIPPFGPYWDDPVSRCYEKRISASQAQ